MVKRLGGIFGFLLVLAFAMVMVSGTSSENNFSISIVGNGTSSSPVTGSLGDNIPFTIKFENTNSSYSLVNISWSGTDISSGLLNNTGNTTFSPEIEATNDDGNSHYHGLNVKVSDENGTILADLSINVYYIVLSNSSTPSAPENACQFEKDVNESGDLEIRNFDLNDYGQGRDDEWQYLDNIEFEVEIKNTGNDRIDDVEVQAIILDYNGDDVTRDFDLEDEVLSSIGRIRDGDTETATFKIKEVPTDIDAGDYYLYVVAYSDGSEDEQCISTSNDFDDDLYYAFSVEPVDYEDAIVVKESDLGPAIDTTCGNTNLEIRVPVANLYDDDEQMVLVNIYNSELGIDQSKVIEDLNSGDSDEASFFVSIPEFLPKSQYDLKIRLYYDWDDNEDEYDLLAYDQDSKDNYLRLNILGCKGVAPTMSPTLASSAQMGTQLVVKTTVTNNRQNSEDFDFSVSGYEAWADLVSVSPEAATLSAGESSEVEVVLTPKESGTQSFKISSTIGDDSYNQPVSVNIKDAQGLGIKSLLEGASGGGVTFYLLVGILGLLLLIFFVLLVKVLRKSGRH